MNDKIKDFLPVGSVVLVGEERLPAVVYGYLMEGGSREDGTVRTYDYLGVPYPSGYLDDEHGIFFQSEDIAEVLCRGYENEAFHNFLDKLSELNASREKQEENP